MVKIFTVEDRIVKVDENCLLIPEFKAIVDKYDNAIPPLTYVYLVADPSSPYGNLEEEERLELASSDVGGDFSLEDEEIEAAIEKYKKLMYTPTQRLYDGAKINLDRLAKYLSEAQFEAGRDGNLGDLYRIQTGLAKLIEGFKKLEKIKDEELKTKLRGSAQIGMY